MYLTSKNLFVVVYCRTFAPLKRILLRGGSPLTIISSKKTLVPCAQYSPAQVIITLLKEKNRPCGFTPLLAQACSLCRKKTSVRLAPSDNYF